MRRARHATRADWFRCHVPDVFEKYVDARASLTIHMDEAKEREDDATMPRRRWHRSRPREEPRVAVPRLRLNAIPLRPVSTGSRPSSARERDAHTDQTPTSTRRARPQTSRVHVPSSSTATPRPQVAADAQENCAATAAPAESLVPRPPQPPSQPDPAKRISSALVRGFLNECGLRERVLTRRREIMDYDDRIILVSAEDDPEKIPSLVAMKKRAVEDAAAAVAAGSSGAERLRHKVLYDYEGKAIPVEAYHHAVPSAPWPPWQNKPPKQAIFYDYLGRQISVEALHCPVPPGDWPPKVPTRPRPNLKNRLWL
jgi:hypothetical protein